MVMGQEPGTSEWRPSALKIMNALSLQEVVNNPQHFQSSTPHYVVADIDWIQTRYLFVKTKIAPVAKDALTAYYEQDPKRLAYNEQNLAVEIPTTAISKSRRTSNSIRPSVSPTEKRTKTMYETESGHC